jgi:hypothetical protein
MNTTRTTLTKSSLAVFLLAGTALGQNIDWVNPAGGLWNVPTNWSPMTVPSMSTETAEFNIGGTYTTTLNVSATGLGSIDIQDAGCTLGLNSGVPLGLQGGMVNNGLVLVNNTNGGFASNVSFNNSAALTGIGVLTLNGTGTRSTLTSGTGAVVSHGSNHTINGIGRIVGDFLNDGLVSASSSGQTLDILNGTWTNNNRFEVTNSSTMIMNNMTIGQGPSGLISVDDGQLNMSAVNIADGTLQSMPGSNWNFTSGTNSLNTVNTLGFGSVNSGVVLQIINTIENDAQLSINPTNGGFATVAEFQNISTLNGNGTLSLDGTGSRSVLRTSDPSHTLTQASTHTIRGIGIIQAPLINNGLVSADIGGQSLLLNINDKVNNNIYQITNASTMNVTSITVDQTGGGQFSVDSGSLVLSSSTILDGAINGSGTTTINSGTNNFDSVVLNTPTNMNSGTVLNITNTLINNNTLSINPTNGGFATTLLFPTSTVLSGSGQTLMRGTGARAQISTGAGETLALASDHIIRGFGNFNASLINNGVINSDTSGQTLNLIINNKINNNLISIEPGASIAINGITIDQDPSAQISVGEGSLILSSANINNGTINATTGLVTQTSGTTNLDQTTLNTPLNMNSGTVIGITNGLVSNDILTINPTNGGFATTLLFNDSSTLGGTGTTRLLGTGARAQLNTATGETVTIGASHTVQGFGQINASLINNGLIETTNGTLTLQINNKINDTLIQVNPSEGLQVTSIEIDQTGGGQILNNDGVVTLTNATINGGTMDALFGGFTNLNSGTSTFQNMTNLSPVTINSGVNLAVAGTITNHNIISINPGNGGFASALTTGAPATVDGMGEIILGGISARSQLTGAGLTLGADQTLSGIGQVNTPLNMDGTIAPGLSVGEIDASQPITLSDSSVYEVEVSDFGVNDIIDSGSTFHADGTLDLSLIEGFDPEVSWVATIVTADSGVTGTFDTLIAPATGDPRLSYKIGYFDNEIRVGAVCDTDFDFSGGLNFLDVSLFLGLYGDMDPIADVNNDGNFNFLDISAFLANYGQSCP